MVFLSRSAIARNPAFMTFPLMMLLSAVATVISGADRRRGEINAERAEYLDHLSDLRGAVVKTAAAQCSSVVWCHPDPDTLWTLVGGCRMWERRAADSDFCHVRIGVGTTAPCQPFGVSADRADAAAGSGNGERVASIPPNPLDSPGRACHDRPARP